MLKSKPWADSELATPLINVASYLLMNGTNVCFGGTVLHYKVHWAQTRYKRKSSCFFPFFSLFLRVLLVKGWRMMLKKRNLNVWRCDVPLGGTCSREYKWKSHEVKYFATPCGHNFYITTLHSQRHFFQTFPTDIELSLFICVGVWLSFNKNMPLWY